MTPESLYDAITTLVAARFDVPTDAIAGACRKHSVAAARRVAMFLAYRVGLDRCSAIADHYNLTPATFSRALGQVRTAIKKDEALAKWIATTEQTLATRYAAQHLRPLRASMPPSS